MAATEPYTLTEPLDYLGCVSDDVAAYEPSLVRFSRPQRHVWAICWYRGEVNNGGHEQFYSNSSGIVWRDALEGLDAADLPEFADILKASIARFPTEPSFNRQARNDDLTDRELEFDDLDEAFYAAEARTDLDMRLADYARKHPEAFLFEGQAAVTGSSETPVTALAPVGWFKRILAAFKPRV